MISRYPKKRRIREQAEKSEGSIEIKGEKWAQEEFREREDEQQYIKCYQEYMDKLRKVKQDLLEDSEKNEQLGEEDEDDWKSGNLDDEDPGVEKKRSRGAAEKYGEIETLSKGSMGEASCGESGRKHGKIGV